MRASCSSHAPLRCDRLWGYPCLVLDYMSLQQTHLARVQEWSLGPGQGRFAPMAVQFLDAS